MSVSTMRYAHSDGLAMIKYTPDGSYTITGGADGDVRYEEALSIRTLVMCCLHNRD